MAAVVLTAVLAVVTWPYATVLGSGIPNHADPMFGVWRLSWFAHAIPAHLSIADTNIFYPERGTFAFSDSIFLLDGFAAPLLWAGANKVLVYNLLLGAGVIGSGLALFLAARTIDIPSPCAIVAAVIFTVAPYRIEHLMHLELQWLAGAVAAIASTALIARRPSPLAMLALAASMVVQFLTSIYYAVFLVPLLGVVWIACIPLMPNPWRTLRLTIAAGTLAGTLVTPIALLHVRQGERLGGRSLHDVEQFSATPADYLATPDENLLYGRPTSDAGYAERRLFPGTVASALAVAGLFSRRRRLTITAVVFIALAFEFSLGLNGTIYPYLYRWLPAWRGFRAAARYGAYVLLGVSTLAALGCEVLLVRLKLAGRNAATVVLASTLVVALCVEYVSPQHLVRVVGGTPPVYAMLNMLPSGVVLEYPTPSDDSAPEIDADYAFWSTTHWRPLINGYSGYSPPSFLERAARLQRFPSDDTLAELRALHVRYVIVHPWAIRQPRRASVLERLALRRDVKYLGPFPDWRESAELFELSR